MKKLDVLNGRLSVLYAGGIAARDAIDTVLEVDRAIPSRDLKTFLALGSTAALERLQEAIANDQLIRRTYSIADKGCIAHFALGISSRRELLSYPFDSYDDAVAVHRCIRYWDYQQLSAEEVAACVKEILAARREANTLESAAIRAARRRRRVAKTARSLQTA